MKQILCYGDSNTWGYDGESRERLPWGVRWTSLLQEKLNKEEYRVIEEGLCGRTTVFENPLRDGRKGTALFPTLLETHAQVDVIVSRNLQPVYEKIAAERHISFLPAASYVHCCDADQEHLNAAGHKKFAEVVYRKVQELL